MSEKEDELQPIIVKKIIQGGGHHGGAWKVAYADFVTAMMAFFLLLWLLNVTTAEQKNGIADYFAPNPRIAENKSGAGGIMGGLTVSPEGQMTSDVQPMAQQQIADPAIRKQDGDTDPDKLEEEELRKELRERENARFEQAAQEIKNTIENTPDLQELAKQIMVDITPEGLRIQLIDEDGNPLFPSGSANMFDKTRALLDKLAQVILSTPNEISIRGHTDGVPYGPGATYTNWELSGDRANASRRVLKQSGVPESRLNNVVGKADKDHLFENPEDPRNRRISIILLREELVVQEGANKSTEAVNKMSEEKKKLYQRSEGAVEFP